MPYYTKDRKRDHNFGSRPHVWVNFFESQGVGTNGSGKVRGTACGRGWYVSHRVQAFAGALGLGFVGFANS